MVGLSVVGPAWLVNGAYGVGGVVWEALGCHVSGSVPCLTATIQFGVPQDTRTELGVLAKCTSTNVSSRHKVHLQ